MSTSVMQIDDTYLYDRCEDVGVIDDKLREQAYDMLCLVSDMKGLGLSANQVGLNMNLFVINRFLDGVECDLEHEVFVNPSIKKSGKVSSKLEGCLSLPGVVVNVPRFRKVEVTAYNLEGQEFTLNLTGLYARVVAHEGDHGIGRLITYYDRQFYY